MERRELIKKGLGLSLYVVPVIQTFMMPESASAAPMSSNQAMMGQGMG